MSYTVNICDITHIKTVLFRFIEFSNSGLKKKYNKIENQHITDKNKRRHNEKSIYTCRSSNHIRNYRSSCRNYYAKSNSKLSEKSLCYTAKENNFYNTTGSTKIIAKDEVDKLEDTTIYSNMRTNAEECNSPLKPNCDQYYKDIGEYFNIIKFETAKNNYKVSYLDTNDVDDMSQDYYYFLQDGSMIKVDSTTGISSSFAGTDPDESFNVSTWFEFDVNGLKSPNKYGYYVFNLYVSEEGKIYYDTYIKRIMEDGWKINY